MQIAIIIVALLLCIGALFANVYAWDKYRVAMQDVDKRIASIQWPIKQ